MIRWILALAALGPLALLAQSGLQAQAGPTPAQVEFFEQKVRPVLAGNCLSCHAAGAMGGLRLDSREALLKGGKTGPAVVPGDPDKSLLIAAIRHTGATKMPMGGDKLSDETVADLVAWVKDGAVFPAVASGAKPESVLSDNFESHIRPVLAQQCFACHTSQKSGGLRLDSREDLLAGGKTGPAVVPGDPDKSLIIAALRHNSGLRMPKGGTRLTDEQIDYFVNWVKDGAYWPADKTPQKAYTDEQKNIWSVRPLGSHPVPAVKDAAWPVNDIDRFVLAKLEASGLKPTTTADRRTLLRRVTYDLTGLMPTYDEVQAFENDKSPNAWEKVVDRLLASPQYGERFARHWMDVVRYGEDDYRVGGRDRSEKYPFAYLYRDWLIRSLNDDMPYDMFVKTQLAADLMDERTRDKHIPALGMNGNGIWIFHANPAPIERADEWHDKVDVTSKAFMGMTVGCARCHDHKYDAIYTKDYYGMASVFASSRFKAYPRVPKSVVDEYEKQAKVLRKKQDAQRKFLEDASKLYAHMLFGQSEAYMMAAWKVATAKGATVESAAEEAKIDPEILARWTKFLAKKPDHYPALKGWQAMVAKKGKDAVKEAEAKKLAQEFIAKVTEVKERYDRLTKENEFALAQVKGTPMADEDAEAEKDPDTAKEPFDPLPNGIKRRLNAYQIDLKSLPREDTLLYQDMFERDVPPVDDEGADDDEGGGRRRTPGVLKLTDGALERRLSGDLRLHLDRINADIEAFRKQMPKQYPFVYGIEDAKSPADLRVFVRGNPYAFGEAAPRSFPSILNQGEAKPLAKGSGRLEMAEELVKSPLVARVIVNRIWRWNMGRGIVDTPSNFGISGDKPTHPELLDFMAAKFVADGMSWKKLTKDILMSRTYQLSAAPVTANMSKDASNTMYWRANRRRVESEGVWDLLLQASGALDLTSVGGPSQDLDDKMKRRGVYARVSRLYPTPFQATFDLPPATISAEKRYVTNVPQQRLFFLNNELVQLKAEAIAQKLKDEPTPEAQVQKAYALVYQRAPTADELSLAVAFLKLPPAKPSATADKDGAAKTADAKDGEGETNDGKDAATKLPDSPLRSFAWALLSSNEFLFID